MGTMRSDTDVSSGKKSKEEADVQGCAGLKSSESSGTRIFFAIFCLVLLVFCAMQLSGLTQDFLKHKPATSVEISRNLKLPDIGILLEPIEIVNKTTADRVLQFLVISAALEYSAHTCADLDRDELESFGGILYEDALKRKPTADEVENFNAAYRKAAPTHEELFQEVILLRRKTVKYTMNTSTLVITSRGPLYKLITSTKAASQVDSINLVINRRNITKFVHILVGTEVEFYDQSPSFELETDTNYIINSRFVHYKRGHRYCSQKGLAGLRCVSNCILKMGKCVPYFGEYVINRRELCGFADYETCKEMFEDCEKECDQCPECRLCEEVHGSSQILSTYNQGDEEGSDFYLRINFPDGAQVQRFIQEEGFTWFSFISNVGGMVGLCFGVSMITFYHCLSSVVMRIMKICCKRQQVEDKRHS